MKKQTAILSEDHILECINKYFPNQGRHIQVGRGDDCAVLTIKTPLCVSADLFIENRHFRRDYFTPEDIGWKALAVNLSDLAACAAEPVACVIGLAIPEDVSMETVEGLCSGMSDLAKASNTPLIGGDLSRARELCLCLTVMGTTQKPLLRQQSRSGDVLFLLGEVGLARTGLRLLKEQGRSAMKTFPKSCEAHLRPKPLIREALLIAQTAEEWGKKTKSSPRLGLMDVSDGLAQDIPRLLGKGFGAETRLPYVHPEITRFLKSENKDEAELDAFVGGEDYSLIGACSPEFMRELEKNVPEITILGYVKENTPVSCNGRQASGFDHFAS